jgi:hypothetical protein
MQALDSFISPILVFEGDIPIPAIPILAQSPSVESRSDMSDGASVGASKNQAGKRKATATLTTQKRAKKTAGKSANGIKINEPAPKASLALTPFSNSRKKIPIR